MPVYNCLYSKMKQQYKKAVADEEFSLKDFYTHMQGCSTKLQIKKVTSWAIHAVWQVSPDGAISIFQILVFSSFIFKFKHVHQYSLLEWYTNFKICVIRIVCEGSCIIGGLEVAICFDLVLKSVLQVELLLVIPVLLMSKSETL